MSLTRLAALLVLLLALAAPAQARFLTPDTYDPWIAGVDINRYAYSGNDPVNQSDPNGHDMYVIGGTSVIAPSPYNGMQAPTVIVPADLDQKLGRGSAERSPKSFKSTDLFSHQTLVETPSKMKGRSALDAIGKALAENATPNGGTATVAGTTNDAGNIGPIIGPNEVRSYLVKSGKDSPYSDIVVNVTRANHTLANGYIMRYAIMKPDGSIEIVTYGEGTALKQSSLNPLVNIFNRWVWEANHDEVEEAASGAAEDSSSNSTAADPNGGQPAETSPCGAWKC